jgi:DNA polymerase III subunit epsilon
MGYALAILAIVLVAGFLMARRHGATGVDNTPELSSRGITTPRPQLSYPDRITADVSNDREKDRWDAIDFVRRIMENKSRYVILDTETTGLGKTDEIVQVAVIDLDGNVLFNENIKPTRKKRMSQEAVAIHGLTMKALSPCRTFAELAEPLERAIGGKTVIAYNALFDGRMYAQTLKLAGGYLHRGDWADIMDEYAKYVGEWDDYHQNYRWQRLPGGTHSALGDCQATLELLRKMAATNS